MENLTFEDFVDRIDMKELLDYAGYHFYRKDGLRYPAFVRLDNEGRRIKGDKFIVTAGGKGCFKPPEQKVYNVISFIKEHPYLFAEHGETSNPNRLVNIVCNKVLGRPVPAEWESIKEDARQVTFSIKDYDVVHYDREDKENTKQFYPYFKQRGIDLLTQAAFADHILLSTYLRRQDGRQFQNIAFPMTKPNGEEIVGLEERSIKHKDGSSYKGKALGTDSVHGMWIASPAKTPLDKALTVYWFESAYDAMAYYQIIRKSIQEDKGTARAEMQEGGMTPEEGEKRLKHLSWLQRRLNESVFISTGGSPSEQQFRGILDATPKADHFLGFDADKAGIMYSCNFLMQKNGRFFNSYTLDNGPLVFIDRKDGNSDRYDFDLKDLTLESFAEKLGLDIRGIFRLAPSDGYKDWNDQLLDKRMDQSKEETDEITLEEQTEKEEKGMRL